MRTYFLSDMHLGAPYFPDSREAELRVVRFLESIRHDCDELYLLGDVLDYWYEYRYVVPKGYVRFFGKLAEMADRGVKITWLIGNHDIWMFGYLHDELGIDVVDGPIERTIHGERFYLAHGDGLGKTPLYFRVLRKFFRNRVCQMLYSTVHPRWTIPLAEKWSRTSRSGHLKEERESPASAGGGAITGFDGTPIPQNLAASVRNLEEYTEGVARENPQIRHFVYGHLHVALQRRLKVSADMTILGDWIQNFTYATFEPTEGLRLHKTPAK